MRKQQNNGSFANFILHFVGILLCVLPPAVCTLLYFPLWKAGGYASCIAGGTALVLALCLIPIYKLIATRLQSNSSYIMWLILFVLFFALSKIADQMTVISFVGFVSNLLGSVFMGIARRRALNPDKEVAER